jgi:DNA-directed RNA polymerase subunit beta'
MDSFHSGGVAASRGGGSVDKFTRLDQLLNIPKILPGAGVLSKKTGTITKIVNDPSVNGHYIHVDSEKHFVPSTRQINVKVGDTIERGDMLTDGNINPRHLLPLKGIDSVKQYLTHALKNEIYKDDTDIRRKNIEVVVRNLTNMTAIKDPGDSHYMTGDKIHLSHVTDFNSKINNKQNPIKHEPLIEGISQAAEHKDEDYLSRFNFRQIKQNLLQAASQGWSTHSHGMNPVGPVAMSTISADKLPGY